MNHHEKIIFKNKLKHFCQELIEHRIDVAKQAIANAREITNQEEKSTVGDKYETARAMGQQEQDMYARQLTENLKELSILQSVDVNNTHAEINAGSFVQCPNISFFIAAGLGKHTVDEKTIVFLSPNAPLAKILLHKKAGDSFVFSSANTVIEDVF
jgi:transcription elongation GreA/GreB family factor